MRSKSFSVLLGFCLALPIGGLPLPEAEAQTFTILHTLTGGNDGVNPFDELLRVQSGNLFGTTQVGGGTGCGGPGCGSVFMIASDGSEKVVYGFQGGNDGEYPLAGLIA